MHALQKSLRKFADPKRAKVYQQFFQTSPGSYAEGDKFIGVRVPNNRLVAKQFVNMDLEELTPILQSPTHEDRLCALLVLVYKYQVSKEESKRKEIVDFYIKNHLAGNNWDLIDCVCDRILGPWLLNKDKSLLYKYARSDNIWERRISIVSTFHFIRNNKFEDTIKISEILLEDKHHLIQKAVGWMLREVGKKDIAILKKFLKKHCKVMPRTMLRYAIEKFPERERKAYLKGDILIY